jgi:Phosphotransferase enzyme family
MASTEPKFHRLHSSIEEMLSPQTLRSTLGRPVSDVRILEFSSVDGRSGGLLSSVEIDGSRFVLKRFAHETDVVMRLTDDLHARSVDLWVSGVLDRLPPQLVHGIVACSLDGKGRAILLEDFTGSLLPAREERLTEGDNATVLGALAALHAEFWEDEVTLGQRSLCTLLNRYGLFTPGAMSAPDVVESAKAAPIMLEGWKLLPSLINPHVSRLLETLQRDLSPLCRALQSFPQTLLHGDWHHGNLGLLRGPEPRVIALDWGFVGVGPPALDLAEYLAIGAMRLPGSKDESIETYRRALSIQLGSRFDESWWRPQLELALLGEFLRLGWNKALTAVNDPRPAIRQRERAEIAWWAEHAVLGARWL